MTEWAWLDIRRVLQLLAKYKYWNRSEWVWLSEHGKESGRGL